MLYDQSLLGYQMENRSSHHCCSGLICKNTRTTLFPCEMKRTVNYSDSLSYMPMDVFLFEKHAEEDGLLNGEITYWGNRV